MDFLKNIDFSSGTDWFGAGAQASSSSGLWNGVTNFATEAFDWIGKNPEASNIIGGVALGAAQGYMQAGQAKDQRAFEREMYDRQREDRMAKPGEVQNYDSHLNNISGRGLLTSGTITGEEG